MLLVYRKFGLPFYNFYHEEKSKPGFADLILPRIYVGCYQNHQPKGLIKIPRFSMVHDLTLSLDDLFARLHTQTRRGIRCAQRDQLFTLDTDTSLDEFLPFCRVFTRERKLSLFELDEVDQLSQQNYRIYTLRLNGQMLVSHLYFVSTGDVSRATLYISAVDEQFKYDNPQLQRKIGDANRLMHWQSMRDFKERGVNYYDWGGYSRGQGSEQLQGIDRFKESFGGEIKAVYNYHSPVYHLIKKLRQRISQ